MYKLVHVRLARTKPRYSMIISLRFIKLLTNKPEEPVCIVVGHPVLGEAKLRKFDCKIPVFHCEYPMVSCLQLVTQSKH